ncbi:MAG TPA: hypothetical protein VJB62_00060, partial [Patescibacteria group bacterium]|nr:hypothetical protein [Patescibacteria group bacterium]
MLNLYNANSHEIAPLPKPPSGSGKTALNKSKTFSFEKYIDPTGDLPTSKFKLGLWYVARKVLLYKILVGGLAGLSAIFWLYSLWQWGSYLIFGLSADRQLAEDMSISQNYTLLNKNFEAQHLQVAGTRVLISGVDKYDIVSEVANPNPRFLVEFDYYYSLGGEARTSVQRALLLPGESRPVAFLGYADGQPNSDASLVLENVAWQRIDAHQVPDVEAWKADRLNLVVKDFSFTGYRDLSGANAHVVNFKLMNDSIYGYDEPRLQVGLYQNESLVGILPLQLAKLRSAETAE